MVKHMILYGADTKKDRTELGDKSLLRIRTGLTYIKDFTNFDYYIYLAAGAHPAHRDKPALKDLYFFYLNQYLLDNGYSSVGDNTYSNGHHHIKIVVIEGYHWGSFEETMAVFLYLMSIGQNPFHIDNLILVSSKSHEHRLKVCWKVLKRPDVQVICCGNSEKKHNDKLEFVKTMETYFFGTTYHVFGLTAYRKASGAKNLLLAKSPFFAKLAA